MSFVLKITKYKKIVNKHSKKENIIKNVLLSFISGGTIGLLGEILSQFLQNKYNMNPSVSYMYLMIILVFMGSVLTGIGIFDKIVSFFKCGLIVPTTGFAHAMSSSAMDNKSEGLVKGIGSNIFKMTGSIILYGIVFGVLFAIIKVVLT